MSSDATLSNLNLKDDYQAVSQLEESSRWGPEMSGPLEVSCSMQSVKAPGEVFQARLSWTSYPDEPPSLKFRDPRTGGLDLPSAWPMVRGFRPQSLDACVSWTAEGMTIHPEWRNDPRYRWDPHGNALLRILRILQDELDEHFQGRYGS